MYTRLSTHGSFIPRSYYCVYPSSVTRLGQCRSFSVSVRCVIQLSKNRCSKSVNNGGLFQVDIARVSSVAFSSVLSVFFKRDFITCPSCRRYTPREKLTCSLVKEQLQGAVCLSLLSFPVTIVYYTGEENANFQTLIEIYHTGALKTA